LGSEGAVPRLALLTDLLRVSVLPAAALTCENNINHESIRIFVDLSFQIYAFHWNINCYIL
jgi:hypothetical protein